MYSVYLVIVLFILQLVDVITQDDNFETTTFSQNVEGEEKISETILKVIEHYKQPNPEGFPGALFPDPYILPDITNTIGLGINLVFSNTGLYGVNKFNISYIKADIEEMKCNGALEMDILQIRGNYSLNLLFKSHRGAFSANLTGIKSVALATLGVERDGKLRAQDVSIDMTFKNIAVDFENASLLALFLQGVFNSLKTVLYDSIKPYMFRDAHKNMREAIDNKLDQIVGDIEFPNTISPLDMVMIDLRKKIKDIKMDPFKIDDYNSTIGISTASLSNTKIKGLASFHRINLVKLSFENQTLIADFSIGTKELEGTTQWEISENNGFLNITGRNSFSVQYFNGRFLIAQPLDLRKQTEFRYLDLEVGNIQIRSDGIGTLDYLIEFSANILPTLLRYQITNSLKDPLRLKLQQELDRINIEEVIVDKLPYIDKMQEEGFQLAAIRFINSTEEPSYDDDEFFNF